MEKYDMPKKLRKCIVVIVSMIMCFTLFSAEPVMAATRVYPDVPQNVSWAKPVYWASENGYVQGYSNGNFGPQDNCTRQQFVVILWRMAGRPSYGNASNPFSDVNKSMSGYRAILWAVNMGIIKGYDNGTFRPQNPVTRAQVVTMLWRQENRPTASGAKVFSDVPASISAYKAVMWGSGSGVVKGFSDGTFRPADNCTRAQIVTFFYRYYRDVKGENVNVTLPNTKPATETEHQHTWIELTDMVHHDAVTHEETVYTTVHHDAVYETVHHDAVTHEETQYELVTYERCGYCGECYDTTHSTREAYRHWLELHEHGSSSTFWEEIPVANIVVTDSEAWDEQVIDTPAWDEQVATGTRTVVDSEGYDQVVVTGYRCTTCGATK